MGADPTLDFLARLADESRWEIRRGIPIFEPHKRMVMGKDKKPKVQEVTEATLAEIAEECNRLEREKGVVGKLTDVHTVRFDEKGLAIPVTPKPKVYGYQKNYRVGTYGPSATPAVLCDWYIYPKFVADVDSSPHRSAEYYHGMRKITGTAVMVNDPFLDLGMVAYSEDGGYLYAMGARNAAMPVPPAKDDKKPPVDAEEPEGEEGGEGEQKPPFEKGKPGEKPPEPDEKDADGEQMTPEEEKLFEKVRTYMCKKYNLDESWPASKPEAAKPKEIDEDPTSKVMPMATPVTPEMYSALQAKVQGIELERDQERCQALLYSLEVEGFQLSAPEKQKELAKLCRLPHAERPDRVTELRKIYAERKLPDGHLQTYGRERGETVEPGAGGGENNPFVAPWYHEEAKAYMWNNPGTLYEAACELVIARHGKK